MDKPSWQATVVALAFIALVGVMFWRAVDSDFAKIWAAVGSIVGVVVGAIPSYFFHAKAEKANQRAEAYASAADPDKAAAIRVANPSLFPK